ncbi:MULTISPECIES: TatD family hydrolase [Vitreoscilla]|uniref:TatD family hydrolase n=1 Tax=Vitreoscilla stercoraria TaxID=61 RepID=A0ABY4E8N0_VITST|nr:MULTISPECIES: TatD family hydrolase [Vitreoscilla]UOO91624.1 TatD family hydrolase [Vitreoscilla stercoraria]
MLIDSHCHLLDTPLWQKLPEIIQAAFASAVHHFIVPCSHLADFDKQLQLCERYACVTPAFGVHPFFIAEADLHITLQNLESILLTQPQALVGEIGLDFGNKHLSDAHKQQQIDFFEAQLYLAQTYQRPVILHHRASLDIMLHSIKKIGFQQGGFLHAYSGNIQQARPWLQLGFKLGLGSVLLKPNAKKIYQLLPHLNSQDYVVETDAPYMPFQNMSKEYNEPANTLLVAQILADFYQVSWQTIAQNSSQNVHAVLARRPLTSF